MTTTHKSRAKGAFTLVELLTVLAIISILAALLLPAVARSRSHARLIACKNNLRQVGVAISMYSNFFGGWMPVDGFSDDGDAGKVGTSIMWNSIPDEDGRVAGYTGLGLLMIMKQQFIGNPEVLYCPDDRGVDMNEQAYNLKKMPPKEIIHGSYIYRQLDAREDDSDGMGKLGSLGNNPAGKPVRAIAADRNYLCYRSKLLPFTDPTNRLTHKGTSLNILFEDGSVKTVVNASPGGPSDLRLDMRSATPPTGTDGTVEEEMDRVWILYDRE